MGVIINGLNYVLLIILLVVILTEKGYAFLKKKMKNEIKARLMPWPLFTGLGHMLSQTTAAARSLASRPITRAPSRGIVGIHGMMPGKQGEVLLHHLLCIELFSFSLFFFFFLFFSSTVVYHPISSRLVHICNMVLYLWLLLLYFGIY